MDSTSWLIVSISVPSYIVFGIIAVYCLKSTSTPHEQSFQHLRTIVTTASHSVEHRYPSLHPKEKKERITQLVMIMLQEQKYKDSAPFTIDALIEESMLQADTDPRLQAIRFSNETTKQITPPAGMMSLGIRHKAVQRTGKLV